MPGGVASGSGAGTASAQLLKLLSPRSSARLAVPQMRYLGRIFAVFRWAGGIGIVALVAVLLPPKHPYWLAVLILWVAAYNGPLTLALNRADRPGFQREVPRGCEVDHAGCHGVGKRCATIRG